MPMRLDEGARGFFLSGAPSAPSKDLNQMRNPQLFNLNMRTNHEILAYLVLNTAQMGMGNTTRAGSPQILHECCVLKVHSVVSSSTCLPHIGIKDDKRI